MITATVTYRYFDEDCHFHHHKEEYPFSGTEDIIRVIDKQLKSLSKTHINYELSDISLPSIHIAQELLNGGVRYRAVIFITDSSHKPIMTMRILSKSWRSLLRKIEIIDQKLI